MWVHHTEKNPDVLVEDKGRMRSPEANTENLVITIYQDIKSNRSYILYVDVLY